MFPSFKARQGKHILLINPEFIIPNPSQPRKIFNSEELVSLAESIKRHGVLQPLTVRRLDNGQYELVAGERRLRASRMVGLKEIPCIEVPVDQRRSAILALIENIQRQDLNCFEEAEGILALIQHWGITQEEAALRLGKAQSTLANKLRLLKLTPRQREQAIDAGLSERHARAMLRINDPLIRDKVLSHIIERKLTVAESERLIERMLAEKKAGRNEPARIIKDVRLFINTLTRAVDTMRKSGLEAKTVKNESEEFIEYVITIPKKHSLKKRCG